ncbi:MAG: dihydroorotase [Chloroflexota bacterium]|nr:dihydroorotase [Chloroflexota bacterium]MDE2941435.1 dihydroorotase [Chloroflexota bacterium]MDE3267647.1 dihydroorotase [Chloroflexota bacterium]
MSLVVKGGRIIDPAAGVDLVGDVLIENGVVSSVGECVETPPGAELLDATGLIVCPGFIDVHCHLRVPGEEHKETMASGTASAAAGGFTTVCAMPNTRPPVDRAEIVELVLNRARAEAVVRVLPIACVTRGRAGSALVDIEEVARAGAVALSDDGSPVGDEEVMREALEKAGYLGLLVIDHCEDSEISAGGVMNSGDVADSLGFQGWPARAEEDMIARNAALAEATGGRVHMAHVTTVGGVEHMRRAKARGAPVTAEVTPHHLTITEEWVRAKSGSYGPYDTNAKVNPPLRTQKDADALVAALAEGIIDCVATDHAPHSAADKDCTFEEAAFGISGLEVALGSLMSLVHDGRLELPTLIERLTAAPARVLGRPDLCAGTLRPGSPADVTIFDPNAEWVVRADRMVSAGRNTPLDGVTLKGRVAATLVAGRVVYRSEEARLG